MSGKIAASLAAKGPLFAAAGAEGHHLNLGPGPALEGAWIEAGLELPNLPAMRRYRLDRIIEQLNLFGYDGVLITDPLNFRYATDTTNLQIWTMHNFTRYAWVGADGEVIVFDYMDCEFMSGHNPLISEVRYAATPLFFISGDRWRDRTERFANEILDLLHERVGQQPRIAIDQLPYHCYKALEAGGVTIEHGQELMELARVIKCEDEIKAMRCAIHACQSGMAEMADQLEPGMTEREVWSILFAANIKRAGEWIETQMLVSGPRTNPWMQEASSRVIEAGEIVSYDTDLVGAYGMMCDISRTWIAGNTKPTIEQDRIYNLALEQLRRNETLLTPGRSFHELCHEAWTPPVEDFFHYSLLYHGVGQCDEYPDIPFAHDWEASGASGHLEPGMVLTTEAYVGDRSGGEGVKLEEQYLVTETGAEMLSSFPIDLLR